MVNYNLGKIYKIVDNTNNNIYIGSTCQPTLARRLSSHRCNFRSYERGKINYITSFDIIKNNNYDIILIENFPCSNRDELHARERHHIETNICINKVMPYTSPEQKQLKIKIASQCESTKLYQKQYRDLHKEKTKEYNKKYNELNGKEIYLKRKDKQGEKRKEYNKMYYQKKKLENLNSN
jgi:hypothetical protein